MLVAAIVSGTSAAAYADEPSVPAAVLTSVSASDPCGDTNLLATTDRPTFGTNPCVVKPKHTIVELGYRNTTISAGNASGNVVSYPNNRDRIGIARGLEVVLDLPTDLRARASSGSNGESNVGTGLKYEFGYFGSFVNGIAVEAVYPTAGASVANGLPSYNGSYQIGGGIFRNVGFNLTLGFNSFASPNQVGGKNLGTTAFQPSLILGGVVAPGTKLNIEIANSSSSGIGTSGRYYGNVFLQHQISSGLLLDIEAEQRFTVVNGARERYFGAGGSIRL